MSADETFEPCRCGHDVDDHVKLRKCNRCDCSHFLPGQMAESLEVLRRLPPMKRHAVAQQIADVWMWN